jgi:hypothetical protein
MKHVSAVYLATLRPAQPACLTFPSGSTSVCFAGCNSCEHAVCISRQKETDFSIVCNTVISTSSRKYTHQFLFLSVNYLDL